MAFCLRRKRLGTALFAGTALWLTLVSFPGVALTSQQASSEQQQSPPIQRSSQMRDAKGQENAPANSQAASPQTQSKKVWTNEDLILLRTPAANYQLEKEAREAAEAQAAARAAAHEVADEKARKEAALAGIRLPSTVEATEALIKAEQQRIDDEQEGSTRLLTDLPNAPDSQKEGMQREINRVAADVPRIRLQIKLLQEHLARLNGEQTKSATLPTSSQAPSANR